MVKLATFRTSQRGKVVCIVDDNVYHMQRVYKDRVYWTCKSRTKGCKARLVTSGNRVLKQNHEHCCGLSTRGVSRTNSSAPLPYNTPVEDPVNATVDMQASSEAATAVVGVTPLDFARHQILCNTMLQEYPLAPESQVTIELSDIIRESPQVPEAPVDSIYH